MCRRIVAAEQDVAAAKGSAGADHNGEAIALREEIGEAKPYPPRVISAGIITTIVSETASAGSLRI